MNTKNRIMFVFQPGGFGFPAVAFSTEEYRNDSSIEDAGWPKRRNGEPISLRCSEAPAAAVRKTIDNQNWIRTVVSLPKALGRSVWSPLARRTQKPVRAA